MKFAYPTGPYGLLAEFKTPEALISACAATRDAGFVRTDAFSPFPVEGLSEALGLKRNRMPLVVLIGGLAGGTTGYFMQWFSNVIHYPINIGGRPLHSWPSFIPITFEFTILSAAFAAVLGMLGLNGLPRPHHPVFGAPGFERASRDRFFLCILSDDPKYDEGRTHEFLEALGPLRVIHVER